MCFKGIGKAISPITKLGGLGLFASLLGKAKKSAPKPKASLLPEAQGMSLLEYQNAQNSRGFMDRIF